MDGHRGRVSGCSRPGYGITPLGGGHHYPPPPIELLELTQDWENRLLEGTNRTLCTRTQEKGAVALQGTDPDLPASVKGSPVEVWVGASLPQGWEH